jgi:hypothetical protein
LVSASEKLKEGNIALDQVAKKHDPEETAEEGQNGVEEGQPVVVLNVEGEESKEYGGNECGNEPYQCHSEVVADEEEKKRKNKALDGQ